MFGKKLVRFWYVLAFGFLLLLLAACGETATSSVSQTQAAATSASQNIASATTAASTTGANLPGQPPKPNTTPLIAERKIIRNATMSLQVNDIEESLGKLRKLAVEQGGFVFSENNTQLPGALPTAQLVLQVPADTYETVINKIRSDAVKVLKHESSSQDVTEEYVDLQSEITNLQKTEASIQKLLDKATSLADITNIQNQLTAIRGEIQKRQGRLNLLDKKSAYSTITLTLSVVPAPASLNATPTVVAEVSAWQPEKTVNESWTASMRVLGAIGTILLQILIFGWWMLPFIVVGFFWLRKNRHRIVRESPATQPAEQPAEPSFRQ